MATTTTVPLTVTPDATARIAELGIVREFDLMLDHTCHAVPNLRSIEVRAIPPHEDEEGTGIIIFAMREDPGAEDDPTDRAWSIWKVSTFPPEICEHIVMITAYENGNAR